MAKHKPYKGERNFKNVIIGAYLRTGTFLDLRFFRPINYDEGTIAEYELCVLRARINARLTNDKLITGDLNAANGCLGSIMMECVMNRTPLGITYEKVLIEFVPPIIANPVGYDAACNGVEFDAVYLQLEQTGRRFVLAKRDSKHLKLVEVTDMDENEIENTGQLAKFPMDISKIEVFKRVEFGDCAEPNKGTASTTAVKQEKEAKQMDKYKPYNGEREFKNCIIGHSIIRDKVLYTSFYKPTGENWWSSDYECFILMARINMRDSDVKNMVDNGRAGYVVGNMMDIYIDNVMNVSHTATTSEKVTIIPPKDASDDAIIPCRNGCMIYDAFSVDVVSCPGTFGIFETERDITLTCVKLAAACHKTRLSEPIANCKLKVINSTSQYLAISDLMKEPVVHMTNDGRKNEHYVQITADNSVHDISSIIKVLHVSYGLNGTKYDNVQMTLHITNPHTMTHKSISFTINKRDTLIVDKHELSFDETVCKLITLININTLNRNVIDKLEINKVGAFTITFENGDYIDINGAKECRLVDGWNNY